MPKTLITLVLLSSLASPSLWAAGNAAAGKTKAYTCTGCHGIPGYKNTYPTYHVPKIAGQNEEYLVSALKAYQAGDRVHSTMNNQAQSLTDEDINDIAAWLSSAAGAAE